MIIMNNTSSQNEIDSRNGFLLVSKYRNAIMGIAALWVLFFHAWIPVMPASTAGHFNLFGFIERYLKAIGYCGVDIFLLVSGLGLTFAIKKGSLLRFYYRRLRRIILPPLVVSLLLWNIFGWSTLEFFQNISGYNFYFKDTTCFLWFIPAIVTLYLLFPLYYKVFDRFRNKILFTAAAIALWLIISLLLLNVMRPDLYGFTNRIPVFIIGVLFGYITQNKKDIVFKTWTYICLIVTLALGLYSLPFLIAKILDLAEHHLSLFGKVLTAVIGFFGTFTLESYCVQEWFVKIINDLMDDGISIHLINLGMFFVINATAWAASVLFRYLWELIELPFKKKKTKSKAN